MPAGFHVASAWVDIHAEDGGLRGEIRSAIESAVAGQDGKVKLNLDAADLRAKVEGAIRSAAAGARGEVKLDLDAGSLRGKVEAAIRAASAGARGEVNLDLDAGSLRAKVSAAVQTATRGVRGTVNIDGDTGKLLAQVGAAVSVINGMQAEIKTDVDTAGMQAKIRSAVAAAGANTRIRVDTDIDYVGKFAAFRAAVAALRPTIHVDVDVDRNQWAAGMRALADATRGAETGVASVGRALTSLRGLAQAGPGALGAVFMAAGVAAGVLAINVAGIVTALASIALPAGIIALGAWLQSARVDFAAFGNELKSLGTSVSQSMAPAIQQGMQTILQSLNQVRPQLTQMFSNAAQLVQPFAQALSGLATSALPGITAALGNMRSAMPGIISGFQQIGQGVGNFFQELTANGPAIGQLWSTLGTGINQVATSLGQALSQITGNQAALNVIGQSFQILAQTIQLAGTALTAFAPAFEQVLQSFSAGLAAIEPLVDGVGRLTSAFSALTGGGGPMAAWDALTGKQASGSEKMAKAMEEANKKMREMQQLQKDFGGGFENTGFDMAAAQAKVLQTNLEAVNQAMARVGAVGGSGLGQIAGMLTQASQSAQAFNQSLGQMNTQAQSALQGQISLAQAISQAKSHQGEFANSLSMSNGQLDLTSTKAQGAAQALNQIAQAGTQAATAFANQGNFTAAAQSLEKARAAVVSLGQSFGLPKAQAQELANSLLQIPDKEVQFKLNIGAAMTGLNQVKAAFDKVGAEEKKITVTAMTEPAQAALEALGFKIKDLGNGKVEVTANTDSAKAALDGLKAVLDALQNKKASVQVEASQVPAVTAALEALGAKVESLPNGDVKVTATDGASTIIDSVKGKLDSIPSEKTTGWRFLETGGDPKKTATVLDDIPTNKNTTLNMTGNAPDKAAEALEKITGIPAEKATNLTATGDANAKAGEVKLKIDGIPNEKAVVVIVNISGIEQIDKLKALNDVQNKAISVQVAIIGTEQISKLEALNKVNNKNIQVNVQVSGADQITKLEGLNKVNNKNIAVVVNVSGNLDKIKELEKLNQVNNKNVSVTVNIGGNLDKIKELDGLNKVANKSINVQVSITGADQISKLKELNNIQSKTITVTVNANAGPIQQIKTAIDGVKNKTVTVTASANAGQVNNLKTAIAAIKAKSVTITANAPAGQVRSLKSAIDSVKSKTVTITANVNGTGAVNALRSAIAGVNSKTVTVTVVTKKVGSAAGGGLMDEASMFAPKFGAGGRSYKPGGPIYGVGSGTSDSILSWLSNGEFVIRAAMVKKYGAPMLAAINHGVFNPYANIFKAGAKRMFPGLPGYHSGGYVGGRHDGGSWSGGWSHGSRSTTNTEKAIQNFITYTIRWGDTLTSIARKFNTTVEALVKLNNIRNPDRIYAGNTLRIPVKQTTPSYKPGVIPGTKPGDMFYLPQYSGSKLIPWTTTTGEGSSKKTKPTAEFDKLKELTAGAKAFVSQFMFPGNNDKDFATKVLAANDLKTLTGILDDMRYTVQDAFKNDEKLSAWLQSGSKLLGNAMKIKVDLQKQLEDAKKGLEELKQAFDQLHDSVVQNIMTFGNITKSGGKGASAETMIRNLTGDVGRSVEFAQALSALKGRGLDGSVIAQIAAAGPVEGLRTARSLLQATPDQILQINTLQGQLKYAADVAGTTAAQAMYGAGLAAAQGLVEGIQGSLEAINAVMKQIADAMAAAIRQALGIKSPSRVFHGIGVNTVQGLIKGFQEQGKTVPEMIRSFVETMIAQGQINVDRTGVSVGNSGTISAGGAGVNATIGGGGITINGGLHIRIDGAKWDLTKSTDRKEVAKALVDDIFEELRERDRRRK